MLRILLLLLPLLLLQQLLGVSGQAQEESYTLVIKTGKTGTTNKVFFSLKGQMGDSPQQSINFDGSDKPITSMFTPGKVDVIEGKFRGALGYISTVKVSQDSYNGWEIESIVVFSDTTRVSNNETYIVRQPQDISFNVNCGWSAWSSWMTCQGTCATGGVQMRIRNPNSPPRINSGKACEGSEFEQQPCKLAMDCPVNGNWSDWSPWSTCSVSCAQGSRSRSRTCTNPAPANGGLDCVGAASDTGVCTESPCPIDGQWGSWSPFSACNASCGPGVQTRARLCNSPEPKFNGRNCQGDGIELKTCELTPCPIDGGWSSWGEFSSCSSSCGDGIEIRNRPCTNPPPQFGGRPCPGSANDSRSCNLRPCPIDGQWSEWSTFSGCSRSCGSGKQWRGRQCASPVPQFGGLDCPGGANETRECNTNPCPVDGGWSAWSAFADCSVTCGNGSHSRQRSCSSPEPQFGGLNCSGKAVEFGNCNPRPCPIDGAWTSWSDYSACSLTCGRGRQWSQRSCSAPEPQFGGKNCPGNSTRDRACLVTECPVDGLWGSWGAWESCSVTCGSGTAWRRRHCDSPEPQFGGSRCSGAGNESTPCHPEDCPINGGWSPWSEFTACSRSCGGGQRSRTRRCDSPPPHAGGADCVGSGSDVQDCGTDPCPVNGGWAQWSAWGSCSRSCGSGLVQRSRGCTNPVPEFGGDDCAGEAVQSTACDIPACPVNGGWGAWGQWGDCSLSCGGGNQLRSRQCDSPRPQNGGGACVGTASDGRQCNTDPCPIDGGWSAWSEWSGCSTSCGTGKSTRQRGCSSPVPQFGGRGCSGSGSDIRDCQQGPCPVHGGWSEWTEFSNCSVTCGNGTRSRSRSCSSPAPQYGGRFCLPCTANLTYPESADNASVSLATVVKDYVSVEDNCSYKGNYYEVDGDLIIWDDDVQYANCSMEPCISTLADKANSFVDEFLKGLNNSGTNKSDSESMKAAQEMVNKITNLLADQLKNAEVGKPVMIDAKGVSVGVSKVNSSNMAGSEMKSGDKGGIVLGDAEDTGVDGQDASLKFSALDPKTFFPGADKKDQSAAVVSLNLAQGTEVVKPSNASKVSLTLSLPNQNQETTENLLQPVAMKRGKRMVQKFTFEAANTAIKASLELPSSDSYLMMFRGGVPANFSKQANFTAWVHSNETMKIETDGSLEVRLKFDTALAAARRRRRRETASPEKPLTLSVFIPGGQMAAGSAVFMSLELADNGTAAAASGSNVTTESANMSLTVGVASITPRAWSDLLGGWVDTDAEVAEESSIEKMVFKSNFFGSYSGKMFIAPNTINFATVFNNFAGKLAENFVTLLVLCLIIGIYVVVSVWMWRLDRQEAANLRYEPLEDNEFDNDYTFIISVYTGDESGADTTSNVFINLAGTWGSSGPSQLSDGVRQNFSRGSVCNFAMTTRAPLGELRGLKVWHDNSGKKPGWFLEKILIEDLQTKKNYVFMCDQWLAENKFDSRTMRVLPEVKQDQRFQEMMLRYKAGGVVNKHVITALFRKTGQSNYSRLQRTGVANAMFFLTMVCNAMWYGKGDDLDAEANFSIDLGPISVTWFQLYSGILSMAITYPCIFAAAEIFRRTKKWQRRWSEDDVESKKKEIRLPKGFLVIGWGLLLLGVGLSFFFTFLYSIEWGKEKANGWLKSFFLGILQLVVVTDPICLLIVFVVAKKIFGQKESEENVFELDDLINDDLKQVLDGTEYAPPDPTRMEEIRAERRNNQKMSQTFTDVMSYVVYMFLLVALAYDSRDQVSFRQNQNLKDQFLTAAPTRFNDFKHVFDWLNGSIVPRLYRTTEYNGEPLTGDLKDAIDTCDCIKQGPFRLRQLRVNPRKCPVTWPFKAYPRNRGSAHRTSLPKRRTRRFTVRCGCPTATAGCGMRHCKCGQSRRSSECGRMKSFYKPFGTVALTP
ncbi:hypothetical protein BOX15_Mlig015709g1 [Macrostomum lignano]|uniref:PLAT domain-containing protein n=1 Tax=Macrostomum lignano TaxID=282301 RepID=A0A267DZT8_9PLAT|nr:hypothetical protein BOX15_Mlig015709g1 [Macrostomum lignano]